MPTPDNDSYAEARRSSEQELVQRLSGFLDQMDPPGAVGGVVRYKIDVSVAAGNQVEEVRVEPDPTTERIADQAESQLVEDKLPLLAGHCVALRHALNVESRIELDSGHDEFEASEFTMDADTSPEIVGDAVQSRRLELLQGMFEQQYTETLRAVDQERGPEQCDSPALAAANEFAEFLNSRDSRLGNTSPERRAEGRRLHSLWLKVKKLSCGLIPPVAKVSRDPGGSITVSGVRLEPKKVPVGENPFPITGSPDEETVRDVPLDVRDELVRVSLSKGAHFELDVHAVRTGRNWDDKLPPLCIEYDHDGPIGSRGYNGSVTVRFTNVSEPEVN